MCREQRALQVSETNVVSVVTGPACHDGGRQEPKCLHEAICGFVASALAVQRSLPRLVNLLILTIVLVYI